MRNLRPIRLLTPFALAAACLVGPATLSVDGDIVKTIDGDPIDGRFELQPNADAASLTNAEGEARAIKLEDIDEVRFGEALIVLRGGNLLLIDNDHLEGTQRKTASIKLRQGLHRFVIPYWQAEAAHTLSISVSGPGIGGQTDLGSDHLRCFRDADESAEPSPGIDEDGHRLPELPIAAGEDRRRMLSRAQYRYYVGDDTMPFNTVSVLRQLRLKRSGTTSAIDTGLVSQQDEHYGLVFEGFFRAPEDGEYTFTLSSDDGSQLYFGEVQRFMSGSLDAANAGPTPWLIELEHGGKVRGEVGTIDEQSLTVKTALGDAEPSDVPLGLPQVQAMWDTRLKPEDINRDNEPADLDTAYIRGKDDPNEVRSVNGRVVGLTDESLVFEFRGQERTITRDRLAGLVFKHVDRPKAQNPGSYQSLTLRTGQVLPGRVLSIGERMSLELLAGGTLDLPREALIMLRSENGRRIDLTRIEPTAEEAIPYFSLAIPYRVNESFSGEPIELFDTKTYKRGLAVHSKSRLHYKLDRPAEAFRARFGLMAPGGKLGDVTARVLGDGAVLWEQANITAMTGVVDVDVALKGVQRLVLEVDFGEGQGVGDRAAWCNPQLIYAGQGE